MHHPLGILHRLEAFHAENSHVWLSFFHTEALEMGHQTSDFLQVLHLFLPGVSQPVIRTLD